MSWGDLAVVAAIILLWAAVSGRAERFGITAPMVFVVIGLALGGEQALHITLSTSTIRVSAELTLVMVLFADAARIRISSIRQDIGIPLRLLSIGLVLTVVLGALFAPIAWLIGIPWHDAKIVGDLLGTRMVINEVIAYSMLGAQKAMLDARSFTIATFALCGFANLSSIGIQIGGIGALAPNRRNDLARLGFRAMLAGTMANLMSASIVGILMR